ADVADDADHRALRRAGTHDDLAERILARPHGPRHRLVDHDDLRAGPSVAIGDVAPGLQGNAHRLGISVADNAHAPRPVLAERQRVGDSRALDAGQGAHAPQYFVDIRQLLLTRVVGHVGID